MKYFDNQFLFSETYINKYITENNREVILANDDLMNLFTNIVEWTKEYSTGDYRDDPWEYYIDAILDVLGFLNKENKSNIRVLYTNPITNGEKPVAICYGIDKEEEIDSTVKGKYYSYNAVKAAKENEVEWAILTNGYKWRIYNTKNISPYEFYLEIDIQASIKESDVPNEAIQLFNLFFNVTAYYTEDGQLRIEKIKEESDKIAESIEEFLRSKSEDILKDLCYGLKENMNKRIYSEEDRKNIYSDAIILLYRLLFFGYAESRGLLPIINDDPSYTDSFEKLCSDAKDVMNSGQLPSIKDGFDFWERLDSHLRVYVDTSYNGGLFHNDDKPVLREHRIANEHLVKCLAKISYNQNRIGKYICKIYYKDLSVRNLGAIYEGLLEYRLFIAEERMVQRKNKNKISYIKASEITLKNSDLKNIIEIGGIYLSQDAMERKETGAYYTPEDVVEYIVENTVGKKIGEFKKVLEDMLKPYYDELQYEPTEQGKRTIQNNIDLITYKFINEKILALSIVDSAMGSGHFLVNAAYRVANEIVSILSDNNWENLDEIPVDIKEWKRKTVENCIYGIDINELSVALARLSLWLISASNDKALSFIDHHLKVGDSIIGATKSQIKQVTDENEIRIFDILPDTMLEPILKKFNKIKEIGSDTKYNVEMQKTVYNEIEEKLKLIKNKFDYYLALKYCGDVKNEEEYIDIMNFGDEEEFNKQHIKPLMEYAKEKNFFHWELEFPQIFAKGGFDIAIGNPPYVDVENEMYRILKDTVECCNLYAYMIEVTIRNLKKGGEFGVILPSSSVSTPRMANLQKYLINNADKVHISTYDDRPGKIFVKLESMRVAIIYLTKSLDSNKEIFVTKYNRFYTKDRKALFEKLNYIKINNYNYYEGYIPKIGDKLEISILNKIFRVKSTVEKYLSKKGSNKLYYGVGVRYWIKVLEKTFVENDNINSRKSSGEKVLTFIEDVDSKIFVCLFSSTLFFWFYQQFSDCRNFTVNTFRKFPFDYNQLSEEYITNMLILCDELMENYYENSIIKNTRYKSTGELKYRELRIKHSKHIIDKIDKVLADYYGLTDEELNFIVNYESNFRIGRCRDVIEDEV